MVPVNNLKRIFNKEFEVEVISVLNIKSHRSQCDMYEPKALVYYSGVDD